MKIQLVMLSFLAFLSSAQASLDCTIKTQESCIILDWVEGPFIGDYSLARLEFYNKNEQLETPASEVKVYPWMLMNGHAHGGRPVSSSFLSEGILEVSKIYFMGGMKGTWQLRLDLFDETHILYAKEI